MKLKIIFFLLLLCISGSLLAKVQGKDNVVDIHFINKQYKHLYLTIKYGNNQTYKTDGKYVGRNNWTFVYPDSLFKTLYWMEIHIPSAIDSVKKLITFMTVINRDTLKTGSYSFSPGITHITATYVNSQTYPHILYANKKAQWGASYVQLIQDQFMVSPQSDKELLSSIEAMGNHFSFFTSGLSYEVQLQKNRDLIKKYPNSHTLIFSLGQTLYNYKTKADVDSLYILFSEKNRQSFYGQKLYRYLNTFKFSNTELPQWKTGALEPIVQDTTKYTLVVFSASWCEPCHMIIPLLKQVYVDLKDKLNMVYVSIDDSRTIKNWRQLMTDEHIPWRSVLAESCIDKIEKKYFVEGVPDIILVDPNGLMRRIDIHDATQRKQLYQLIEKNN